MKLLRLELFGFKSFADKTVIHFDQGVTCIVGPNGCGKSNISDSIRWVLGERSAKLLRGSSMEDVIFSGTEFRKPLSMVEVAITIDNSDKGLPIDFKEVTIARRLYRSGESEYLINKTPCRLRDIQDLILDTGIGSSSYSMIEQGRIDYILNADADERRFLIEEAAGISKYKVKKDEAIRKLERTEENRLRLNDIIAEVHKNIQYAERQAKRAQKYQEQFERLKKLETIKAFEDLRRLELQRNQIEISRKDTISSAQQMESELSIFTAEQDSRNAVLRGILDRFSAEESNRHEIQIRMEQNSQKMQFHHERRMEMASRFGQIEQELKQLQERSEKSGADIIAKRAEAEKVSRFEAELREQKINHDNTVHSLESKLNEIRSLSHQLKNEGFNFARELAEFRNRLHQLQAFTKSSSDHKRRIESAKNRAADDLRVWQSKFDSHQTEIKQADESLQMILARKSDCDSKYESVKARHHELQITLENYQKNIDQVQTRLDVLSESSARCLDHEKEILESSDLSRELIHSLRTLVNPKPGYEWALDGALDFFSKSLVVSDAESAYQILNKIRTMKSDSIGLFVLKADAKTGYGEWTNPNHPEINQSVLDVVDIRPGFENIFYALFKSIWLLHCTDTKRLIDEFLPLAWNCRFVTPEGCLLGPAQQIFFRNISAYEESSFYRQKAEIDNLNQLLATYNEEAVRLRNNLAQLAWKKNEFSLLKDEFENQKIDLCIQKETLSAHSKSIEDRLQSLQRELTLHDLELTSFIEEERLAVESLSELERQAPGFETRENELHQRQENVSRELQSLEEEKATARDGQLEVQSQLRASEQKLKHLTEAVAMLENLLAEDQARIVHLTKEYEEIKSKEQTLISDDQQLELEQSGLEEQRRHFEIALELIRREKQSAEDELLSINEKVHAHQTRLQECQNSFHQFDMQLLDIGYQEKNVHERLLQTYRIKLTDFKPEDFAIDTDAAAIEHEIQGLRDKVESIGTVNLLAVEEYDELKKRYEFLMGQQKDLDDARNALMETIRTINKTTKNLFEETFTNVQQFFQEYYQTLFRGGIAKLVLVDESNPLESGIDIVVRPPGKKLQHISLLSGGEKALTAIALLFSLFKIKPSPFCVLDEVDAPLDEANVDRFISVLKTFLTYSQFIIVTHNRKTISMGNSLYGVTMEEPGISKLVSVKVEQDRSNLHAEEPVPAETSGSESAPEPVEN